MGSGAAGGAGGTSTGGSTAGRAAVAVSRHHGAALSAPWTLPQLTWALALKFPGRLDALTDFTDSAPDIEEADSIMAKHTA